MNGTHLQEKILNSFCEEEKSVVERVTSQAETRPEAIALASSFGNLTYQQLNARADQLANCLVRLGVEPDMVVGLCVDRTPAMIIGALGVLKAGGAYLPINPNDPAQRLIFQLDDAQAQIVITTAQMTFESSNPTRQIVRLDDSGRMLKPPDGSSKRITKISPASLAYVIYTSGSTGQPKGVEITHAGLSNLVNWHQSAFQITPEDRATQLARVSFDAAVWEIWPYLTAGASVHLPTDEVLNDPEALRDWLIAQSVTISFVPTPMTERLLSIPWPSKTALRALLTGGDVLHRFPPANLPFTVFNNYGPTECAVVATSCIVPPSNSNDRLPPIGRPIPNARLHILDSSLRPVPAGTPGELYIGGPGVARGYRNRPDLTADRFIANPFGDSGSLFKTGDMVQSLPDGQLGFLGRLDEQIKIRGFRIEPHEIVVALDAHPAIAASTVVAQNLNGGDCRLVAYFVYSNSDRLTVSQLRDFLASRLPDYMVPAAFMSLDSLPLTANGKVDRAALPPANENNVLSDDHSTDPETELEKSVAGMLAPLLGVKKVDVRANFFSLGGHSLLGTQLISRLRDAFGVDLPLRTIFEAPTVSGLSAEIDRLLLAKLEGITDAQAERLLDLNTRRSSYPLHDDNN